MTCAPRHDVFSAIGCFGFVLLWICFADVNSFYCCGFALGVLCFLRVHAMLLWICVAVLGGDQLRPTLPCREEGPTLLVHRHVRALARAIRDQRSAPLRSWAATRRQIRSQREKWPLGSRFLLGFVSLFANTTHACWKRWLQLRSEHAEHNKHPVTKEYYLTCMPLVSPIAELEGRGLCWSPILTSSCDFERGGVLLLLRFRLRARPLRLAINASRPISVPCIRPPICTHARLMNSFGVVSCANATSGWDPSMNLMDVLHVLYLGVGQDFVGSAIKCMAPLGYNSKSFCFQGIGPVREKQIAQCIYKTFL